MCSKSIVQYVDLANMLYVQCKGTPGGGGLILFSEADRVNCTNLTTFKRKL